MGMKVGAFLGLTALAAVATMSVADVAGATQSGAFVGNPQNTGDWTCFQEHYGAVEQGACSGDPAWEVGLPVGGAGNITPTLWVSEACLGAGYITCGVDSVSDDGAEYAGVSGSPSPCSNSPVSFQPGTVYVPSGGYAFAACYMDEGVEWYSVSW
jgi:hypothetical protein